jgi:hypothetical protein
MAGIFNRVSTNILERGKDTDTKDSDNKTIGLDNYAPEPEAPNEDDQSEDGKDSDYQLEDCAHDIISAVKSNDPYMLADALREAFQKLKENQE